jgi:dolichol-phosphate mannosyltransferase
LSAKVSPSHPARAEKIFLFGVGGGCAALFNLALAYLGISVLGFDSVLQQNVVNLLAMEASLLFSFVVYRTFVWRLRGRDPQEILLKQLPMYHLSAGAGILARVAIFPVLQYLGVHYLINIAVGIVVGAALNFVLADRFVFKEKKK